MTALAFTIGVFVGGFVGGSSESTQTAEFRPDFEWIVHLWNQAKSYDLPVYMKTNLGIEQRVREYPVGHQESRRPRLPANHIAFIKP